jgi:2-polyprenyl-3-methyl-5-hydroxy-6-metoxy-1,4-benzoquinol methylase/uncharacterized protein (DUF2062 family)
MIREEARRAWHELRGGRQSPARLAAAVAIGVFVGSQPIYGLHTPIVIGLCLWLQLDAAVAWVASNVSNPLFAPFLVTLEVETGAYLLTGGPVLFDVETARAEGVTGYLRYAFAGGPVVGLGLAAALGLAAFGLASARRRWLGEASARRPYELPASAPPWVRAVERVAGRYAPAGQGTHAEKSRFHYARWKLLTDPVARLVADVEGARDGALGEVLDVGCGRGQLALLLVELGRATRARGVDWDAAKVDAANEAARRAGLAPIDASFSRADARAADLEPFDTVLLVDLLHYFAPAEQDAILRRAAAAVRPGGRLLLREADAERGLRSAITLAEERLFTVLRFNRGERVKLRPVREMTTLLEGHGFACEVLPAWGGTPFSNVLVVARRAGSG